MNPCFITLDALGLKQLNINKETSVSELIKKAKKMWPHKELGRSFKTDGTQSIIQYIKIFAVEMNGTKKQAKLRTDSDNETLSKLEKWRIDVNMGDQHS